MSEPSASNTDFYQVLGVTSEASDEEIRAAYKKAAIQWHPDKHRQQKQFAEAKFKEISTAYAVLSDPAKRSKYDSKGFEGLNEQDLSEVELDLSSLGTVNSVFASLFTRLGVLSVKTMVSPAVIEQSESGKAELRPLFFGMPVSDKVEKNCAHYYNLSITQEDIDTGFCIWVKSPSSRFKVLMFDKGQDDALELKIQEDSIKELKNHVAGIFFFTFQTFKIGLPPSALQCADDPESTLFRRLDQYNRRDAVSLFPGEYAFAVYGDNFLKSSIYTIEALLESDFKDSTQKIKRLESDILKKQEQLRSFETRYRAAKKAFEAQVVQFETEMKDLTCMINEREEEYAKLSAKYTSKAQVDNTLTDKTYANQFKRMFRRN